MEEYKNRNAADPETPDDGSHTEPMDEAAKQEVSETWAEETISDLDDFIESQGIYIRQ